MLDTPPDEPDIPMLDVGDFEVLDECVGEDDNEEDRRSSDGSEEEEDNDHHENPKRRRESARRQTEDIDENSGDNADNILDVSIDVSENDFLENVAKDFSENIEEEIIEVRPRITRSSARKVEPQVQLRRIATPQKAEDEPEVVAVIPKKKPGPRSKTMNIQTPVKKTPIKINFADKSKVKKNESVNDNKKNTNTQSPKITEKNEQPINKPNQNTQNKTPAFLKKDLTDEEIMIHFDEIENTVLTSDNFVIQNEVEQLEKEESKDKNDENNDIQNQGDQTEDKKNEENEEENWDDCDTNGKKQPKIKIEQEQLKESEMWYKEKVRICHFYILIL